MHLQQNSIKQYLTVYMTKIFNAISINFAILLRLYLFETDIYEFQIRNG